MWAAMRAETAAIAPGVVDLSSPTWSAWEEKGTGDLSIEMGEVCSQKRVMDSKPLGE